MTATFTGSTVKVTLEERGVVKYKNNRRMTILLIVIIILLAVAIAFVALYVKSEKQNKELIKKADLGKNTGNTKVPIVTTNKPATLLPAGKGPYQNIRLPKNVLPSHYDLYLDVDLNTTVVNGWLNLTIKVTSPTRYIIIHSLGYQKVNGIAKNDKGEMLAIKRQFNYVPNEFRVIELENEIPKGKYQLDFEFSYVLNSKDLKGFYEASYRTKSGTKKIVAATQFEPVSARIAFPCFDEPAMKATFNITIAHDPSYIALGNMPIEKTWSNKAGKKVDKFELTPIMPTYLVAFVICDFSNKTVMTKSNVRMTYYAPTEQIDQIDYSMAVGKEVLPYFEEYYNVSYPLPKADMIAIPDFSAGAMENWGLITYRAKALLYDKHASSISNRKYVASVVSHELAHQWFGNIVTMDWWSDLWLNEGFASYVEYLGINKTHPEWNVLDFQVVDDMATGLGLDALITSHPIYIEVKKPSDINEIFDSISYQKGASVLRMLNNFIGTDVFVKGLNIYLKRHSYSNAKTNDLWDALSEASGYKYNVSEVMNTWILQMGFPVVNVTNQNDGSFKLTQSRFLRDKTPDYNKSRFVSPYNYKWVIPFNYVVLNITDVNNVTVESSDRIVMDMAGATIKTDASDLIIKGNFGQYGFFRVNYDLKGWKSIENILHNNHKIFDVKDRAGILLDAFALANSGRLPYSVALDLFDYIDKDTDYIPWNAAANSISSIPFFITRTRPADKMYKKYMRSKVSKLFGAYVFNDTADFLERYLQTRIATLACSNGHQMCKDIAVKMFKNWMQDPEKNVVPADFRNLVYYYGVYYGGIEEWDFVFKRYLTNKIASEKTKLMYALAAIQEPWAINRYLRMALNESIVKTQDVSYVFSYVANYNPIGRYLAWYFLKENWPFIETKYADSFFTMRRLFSSVAAGFTTQYELEDMQKFVKEKIKNQGSAKRIIQQSEEKVNANIEWLASNEKPIQQWLEKKLGV